MSGGHDEALARAFDGQSAQFEKAPVQTDPAALERLVRFAGLEPGAHVLDVGCGPGLVARAFLDAGHRVTGVDLSAEMIARAQERCASAGDRVRFVQGSFYELDPGGPFDAVVSRYVLHHVEKPQLFAARQVGLLRPGGAMVLCDHRTDPNPMRAQWHNGVERMRDRTHTRNLTGGEMADLLAQYDLRDIRLEEERFTLDFDEWFDRGTPAATKEAVRERIVHGPGARGFQPTLRPDGGLTLECVRVLVRGVK